MTKIYIVAVKHTEMYEFSTEEKRKDFIKYLNKKKYQYATTEMEASK